MAEKTNYDPPAGQVGLTGPVERPGLGTLPLRGDLAHIALAERFLVAHYAVPRPRQIGPAAAPMHCTADLSSDTVTRLEPGTAIEALDYAGDWCWACLGPDGPAGYIETRLLAD